MRSFEGGDGMIGEEERVRGLGGRLEGVGVGVGAGLGSDDEGEEEILQRVSNERS